jgi:fatty acid-binding protein DegV
MKYRIVSDSSSNYLISEGHVDYRTVPLKILIEGKEYSDEIGLNTEEMVLAMERSEHATFTSCPNTQKWLNAFEGADGIFVITTSSKLSGS